MINDGQVFLAGFVATPPSFRKVAGDRSAATVRIAVTPRWLNRGTGEWTDGQTSFLNVHCWRGLADNVAVCLRKGEPVLVMGRLRSRSFTDREGTPRTVFEVEADSIGHDMRKGVSHFSRTRRPPEESAEGQEAGVPAVADVPPADAGPSVAGERTVRPPVPAGGPGEPGDLVPDGDLDDGAVGEFTRELGEAAEAVAASF